MAGLNDPLTQLDYGVAYTRGPESVTQVSGLAGLAAPSVNDIARANANALDDMRNFGAADFAAPPASAQSAQPVLAGPVLAISRSSGKIWANGKLFTVDDAQGAVESEQYLSAPPAPAPAAEAGDWEPLSMEALSQHIQTIKNPGMGTLASKNFGIGVDNMQMLGGYGLQFLGAEETGQSIVRNQLEDIRKNAPYQRNFEDIGSDPSRGVLDWFVANLAQQGPNLVESVVTAAVGALAGGAAGGGANPFSAAGGALTAMVGKQAFKQSLLAAAKKYTAGEVLDAAEKKLLYEAAGLTAAGVREAAEKAGVSAVNAAGQATAPRTAAQFFKDDIVPQLGAAASKASAGGLSQARAGGAALFSAGQNYATGVADLYGDSVEGNDPSRGLAALGGIPYAAMETVPEYLAALRFFKGLGIKAAKAGGKAGRAGTIATNVGVGLGAGAALEGATELGQESLGIGMNADVDIDSPEGLSRLLNAFAAGAAIGGFVGGASSMNTGKAHDLLSAGTKPAEPNGATLSGEVIPPTRPGGSMVGPDGSVPRLGGPGAAAPPPLGGPTYADEWPEARQGSYYTGNPADDAALNPETSATPVSPSLPSPQGNMLSGPQPAVAALPAPPGPAQVAPASAVPDVIPLGGPIGGSALQQVATGQLEGGVPPALPNRLQQAQAAARQRQLEATSGSALARLGRGDLPVPVTQPGGTAAMSGEATGEFVQPMKGKAKLKRGKKVMQVEGMPLAPVEAEAAVTQTDEAPMTGELAPAEEPVQEQVQEEISQFPVHDKFIAELDDARLNLENKLKLKNIVKRALAAGVLTQPQANAYSVMFKDKDMTVDDIAPEITQDIELNKEAAPNADKVGVVPEDDKLKRTGANKLLQGDGEDRLIDTGKSRSSEKAGNSNRLRQGKKEAEQAEKAVIPKAEGAAAAPSKKAEETTAPKQALVVAEPKEIVDPEKELVRSNIRNMDEWAELAESTPDAVAEVENFIMEFNAAEPGTQEYDDALDALVGYSKDKSVGKAARTRAQDYLAYEVDDAEVKLSERRLRGEDTNNDEMDFALITKTMEQINNGELRLTQSIIGKLTSAWKRIKDKGFQYNDQPLSAFIKGGPQFFRMKDGKVEGKFSISDFDSPDNPLPAGRIKLIIQKFISKFALQPKVHVFRNQADLKASDPKLYAKMRAGRPEGDFDSVRAAGYSMGDTIIIFSDRIGSEDHLAFVLAHETLGHFGFRGLMGDAELNALMEKLYDSDENLRAAVDAAMKVRGLKKAEAVEEYLSDYAGRLHTRLLARFWKGVKSVLNRVGIKFGDEATRYLLDQSKRYVRTGQRTGVFETSSVLRRIWAVEHGLVGRFSSVALSSDNERVAEKIRHDLGWVPMDLKEAAGRIKDFGGSWDGFKEKFFSLLNYQALRNPGLYEFEKLLDETRQHEQYIHNKYNERLTKLFYKSNAHKDIVSRALLLGREASVFRLLKDPLSLDSRKEALFQIDQDGNVVRNTEAIDRYIAMGILSFKEMKDGGKYTREYVTDEGQRISEEVKFPGVEGLTQEHYDDYKLSRQNIAEVEIELLEAKYKNFLQTEKISKGAIRRMMRDYKLEGDAEKLLRNTLNKYKEIYVSGYTVDARGNITPGAKEIKSADDFLEAVNRALISSDEKNDPAVQAFFDNQKDFDDFAVALKAFRSERAIPKGDLTYMFQNEVKRVILEDVNLGVEEERAKRTMAAGYVPVIRDKQYEIRIDAVDSKGNNVHLSEDHRKLLVYAQVSSMSLAKQNADMLQNEFNGKTYKAYVRQDDGSYKSQDVTLQVKYGPALTQIASDPALNLDEFMHGLRLFGINLRPDQMTAVIRDLTKSGDALRKRLEFSNTPGYDKTSGVFAMARHIQMRASTIAKTITRPRLRDLLDRSNPDSLDLWAGDKDTVIKLHTKLTQTTDPEYRKHLQRELDTALYMFRETYPEARGWDGSRAGYDKIKGDLHEANYNRFYNSAQKTMDFLEANQLVSESNFGAGRTVSALRAGTSIFQLGGSIAQGVMNLTSPYTNWMPYMMSYNSRNGFGGGFGAGAVVAEYHKAMTQVGAGGIALSKYNSAEYYEGLMNNPAALIASGLTKAEANFLAEEIREGKLIPAQANALLGTARAGISNPFWLRSIDIFMSPFNRTEQASRRAAGLAAFRLAYKRMAADTKMSEQDKINAARDFAIQSLDLTLGEYSVLNRPPAWRDGIQSFLYMYKVYPTTTIQLFRRLDKKGRIIMLGLLWLVAGVAGFPFAEDIEDLVDTISQMLGLQMGSVRAEFAKLIDDMAPGLSPMVLRGFVNGWLGVPADIAGRFSMGDFVPGTGMLLAGATVGQEFKDIFGPMPAMTIGLATMARDLITAPLSEGKSFQDALRASPVTLGRMVGDTWAYWDNGAVVDRRGYVVSPDMSMSLMAFRLMGFYPDAAAKQYEAIRIAKRVNNYQKEVVAYHRYAWVKAMLTGNRAYARQIEKAVEDWNRDARGTGLEINDFVKNSQRALKEAKMSATQRTLRSTAKAGREDTERVMELLIQ